MKTDGWREARLSWKPAGEDACTAARDITETGKTALQTVNILCICKLFFVNGDSLLSTHTQVIFGFVLVSSLWKKIAHKTPSLQETDHKTEKANTV